VLEWARRGKRVSPKVEGIIHSIGFIILLGLMVLTGAALMLVINPLVVAELGKRVAGIRIN